MSGEKTLRVAVWKRGMFLYLQLHVVTTLFQKLFPKEVKYISEIFQVPVFITTENMGAKHSEL